MCGNVVIRENKQNRYSKKLVSVKKTVQRITHLFNRTGSVSPAVQSHGPARKLSEFEELTVLGCFFS